MISFSYARKASTTTPPISVNIADLPRLSADSSGSDDGMLPIPGFEIIVATLAFVIIASKRREL
jgi:hypothetical protein